MITVGPSHRAVTSGGVLKRVVHARSKTLPLRRNCWCFTPRRKQFFQLTGYHIQRYHYRQLRPRNNYFARSTGVIPYKFSAWNSWRINAYPVSLSPTINYQRFMPSFISISLPGIQSFSIFFLLICAVTVLAPPSDVVNGSMAFTVISPLSETNDFDRIRSITIEFKFIEADPKTF